MPETTLITGPVRSGKSRFALCLARESGRAPLYVATALVDPADSEMIARVARHRDERGSMPAIETNEDDGPSLADVLAGANPDTVLIVDSLGTWLGGFLRTAERRATTDPLDVEAALEDRARALRAAVERCGAAVILVAEETGWGVVPDHPLGRIFRDVLGRMTANFAAVSGHAYLVVAGIAIDLKTLGRPVDGERS